MINCVRLLPQFDHFFGVSTGMAQHQVSNKAILPHAGYSLEEQIPLDGLVLFQVTHAVKGAFENQDAGFFAGSPALVDQRKTGRSTQRIDRFLYAVIVCGCLLYPFACSQALSDCLIPTGDRGALYKTKFWTESMLLNELSDQGLSISQVVKCSDGLLAKPSFIDGQTLIALLVLEGKYPIDILPVFLGCIETGPLVFDLDRLQHLRHQFGGAFLEFDPVYMFHEAKSLAGQASAGKMAVDAKPDVLCLADIDGFSMSVEEIIDAGRVGQSIDVRQRHIGWPFGLGPTFRKRFRNDPLRVVFEQTVEQFQGSHGIPGGPVTIHQRNAKRSAQLAQAVGKLSRKYFLTQSNGTKSFPLQPIPAPLQGGIDERMIELNIVCHENFSIQ